MLQPAQLWTNYSSDETISSDYHHYANDNYYSRDWKKKLYEYSTGFVLFNNAIPKRNYMQTLSIRKWLIMRMLITRCSDNALIWHRKLDAVIVFWCSDHMLFYCWWRHKIITEFCAFYLGAPKSSLFNKCTCAQNVKIVKCTYAVYNAKLKNTFWPAKKLIFTRIGKIRF